MSRIQKVRNELRFNSNILSTSLSFNTFAMKKQILFSALLVIAVAAFCQAGRTPPVDDDEDLDEIVGGKKANLTNFQFLVISKFQTRLVDEK